MKNLRNLICILVITLAYASCSDQKHFVNGSVVTENRYLDGIAVQVDTTGNGIADIEAWITGSQMSHRFQRCEVVSVKLGSVSNFASLVK